MECDQQYLHDLADAEILSGVQDWGKANFQVLDSIQVHVLTHLEEDASDGICKEGERGERVITSHPIPLASSKNKNRGVPSAYYHTHKVLLCA